MEERTLGGKGATGQDVSIILVPSGGTKDHKLACVRLHSGVLRTHSKYFDTCLSERWNGRASPCKSSPMEFVLEAQTGVESYFDCFSRMYSPFHNFEGVGQALETLKVASQIDFQGLMERISLYLSCKHWSQEDDVRVREYIASPDFPRIHLKDLVARLGMNASKEQLCDGIRECVGAVFKACCEKGEQFPEFLKGLGRGPTSEFSTMVLGVVNNEAQKMFVNIANEFQNGKSHVNNITVDYKLGAMKWVLESLLDEGVAEELVQGIVHLDAIPKYAYEVHPYYLQIPFYCVPEISEVVLRMYKEVAAGVLLLGSRERFALLANWNYKRYYTGKYSKDGIMYVTSMDQALLRRHRGALLSSVRNADTSTRKQLADTTANEFEEASAKLFSTLSSEEQGKLVKSLGDKVHACLCKVSIRSLSL